MSRIPTTAADRRRRSGAARGLLPLALGILASLAPAGDVAAARRPTPGRERPSPPLPPLRPVLPVEPSPAKEASPAATPSRGPADADPAACLARLAAIGVVVHATPPIEAGPCGARHPFRLATLPGGVALAPGAQVGCPIAEALARWVAEGVVPEARSILGRAPVRLLIGASYECRGRNRVTGATLSEHAFANAIDIMGFAFDKGEPLAVKAWPAETPEARFLAAIRARACAHFTTVLGPGSDAAHADHLHLDGRERKSGFRMCQ